MRLDITYDFGQLDEAVHRLRSLDDRAAYFQIVEGLADLWIDTAKRRMGKDTHQLETRTMVQSVRARASGATADLIADTPYAGFHNYGTRHQKPNRFWDLGLETAEREANRLGLSIETQIQRVLESGGVWNPRGLF